MTIGINTSYCGPLLIPVISELLLDSLKLIFPRKLGKSNWHITYFRNCIKEVKNARVNCKTIKDKDDYRHLRKRHIRF